MGEKRKIRLLLTVMTAAIFLAICAPHAGAERIIIRDLGNSLEVKEIASGNETMTQHQMAQQVLRELEGDINPELDNALRMVFLDKSSPEYLSAIDSNISAQFWSGNGSLMNGPNRRIAPDAFPGYYLNESGVYSEGSDTLRVVRLELIDRRTYGDSGEWYAICTIENTGPDPVYVHGHLLVRSPGQQPPPPVYTYLDSGERMQFQLDNMMANGDSLRAAIPVEIDYCRVKRPAISPEFMHFEKIRLERTSYTPFIQINNVSYRLDDAAKGWATLHLEYQPIGNRSAEVKGPETGSVYINSIDEYGQVEKIDFEGASISQQGETISLDVPLKGIRPDSLYGLYVESVEGNLSN